MRGLEFNVPHSIEDIVLNFRINLTFETYNWNPFHFAIFYMKMNVIEAL